VNRVRHTPTASQHLARAIRRLGQALNVVHREPEPDDPAAIGEWQARMEARMVVVERMLVKQNRLLLISVLGIMADVVVKLWNR
jgi:hypothetical protein